MGLFKVGYIRQHLPEGDERAMDLLWQIDQIYNAYANTNCSIAHTSAPCSVDQEVCLFFIEISVHNPHLLEEKLASEPNLLQLVDWATSIMSCTGDSSSIATEKEHDQ